jgi:hypothetical protein
MGKITIYIRLLADGRLEYRDSEEHEGKTIETSVDPGDKITWTLDKDSGISDITGLNIVGTPGFMSKGPSKKAPDKWTAKVAKDATGEIAYYIFYAKEATQVKSAKVKLKAAGETAGNLKDEDPPIIRIKD